MSESDTDYFQLRAEKDVERARLATKPEVGAVREGPETYALMS